MTNCVRVLIIEDQADLAADAKREIQDAFEKDDEIGVVVSVETDFEEGLKNVRARKSDVVVLDVRRDASDSVSDDPMAGHSVYSRIKDACFAPVVFWTALPWTVENEEMPPLVTVVSKEDLHKLPLAIKAAVTTKVLDTIKEIEEHTADVVREHMWAELAPNWDEYTKGWQKGAEPGRDSDSNDDAGGERITQVLLNRLARILADGRNGDVKAHPSYRYVYPPASSLRSPGDILREGDQTWWVVLTPACDFAQNKVNFVLLAKASLLTEHEKYKKWASSNLGSRNEINCWNNLRQDVLNATHGRYHFLPEFRAIPNLVIDLENVKVVDLGALERFKWIASLVSPFAEALLMQYSHVRGRIGVPDLDFEFVKERLLDGRA